MWWSKRERRTSTPQSYRCVHCGSKHVEEKAAAFQCGDCRTGYPVMFGVPLFLESVNVVPSGYQMPDPVARRICKELGLPGDQTSISALRDLFSYNYELADSTLAAENNYFLNRVVVAEEYKRAPLKRHQPEAPARGPQEPSLALRAGASPHLPGLRAD